MMDTLNKNSDSYDITMQNTSDKVDSIYSSDKDREVIQLISSATGVVYSDEQLKILNHHGGMAIMAAAGSGKTTVLTHLITKRILSGEIADTSKVLCTTYSKAGADEMEERINKLLDTVGIKKRIMVKTMHAFYLLILQHFGYSMKLVDNAQRARFIREACTKADVKLTEEDMQTLDSLLSYQVNNLLSDKDLFNSYVYSLNNVPIEKYTLIHNWYSQLKKNAGMMDFDDMQLYVYFWLCVADENTKTAVTSYIQQTWNEFYIDEAQDLSKIQMAILRKMCTDSSKVVFIGDDDQCLVEGTKVATNKGLVNIENISVGDEVYTGDTFGSIVTRKVSRVSRKQFKGNIVVVTTDTGKVVKGTPDHTGFVELENDNNKNEGCTQLGKFYSEIDFVNLQDGMYVPVKDDNGKVTSERIKSVGLEKYEGYVYDISVPYTRNFVANGVIVHNCIYEWRGADPSLLINIAGYYDIQRFVLSTNYRCRAEIVDTAAVGIKFNTRRSIKEMTPFHNGGEIKVIDTTKYKQDGSGEAPDIYNMSKYAFIYIKDLVASGISPSDIAVLSRNNTQLTILNNMLFREGIYCTFTKDMRFTGNSIYKELKQILELAKDEYNHKLTSGLLWKVVPYFSAKNAKVLADFQEKSYMRFSDMLGYFLTECCNMSINWEMPSGVKIPEAYKVRLQALARQLNTSQANNLKIMYKATVYDGSTEEDAEKRKRENEFRRIANYMGLYIQVSVDFLYRTEDKQRTCIGYIEYFKKMVKDWGLDKTLRFLNVTQQYESGMLNAFTEKVNMSTMHGAKGKEWSHVVLFADDNITFPCFRSFVDLQRKGVSKNDIHKVIEEDRRLHYVAMTRAKNTLAIVTYADNISVYSLEAFGILKDTEKTNNESIFNMAMINKVDASLIAEAKKSILNKNSDYYIDIDVSRIEDAPDIEFCGIGNDNTSSASCAFSLDDMAGTAMDMSTKEKDDDIDSQYNNYKKATESIDSIGNSGVTLSMDSDDNDYDYASYSDEY